MNPDDKSSRRYSPEEINDILRRALERQGPNTGITYNELLETAREIGIDPGAINEAIDENRTKGSVEAARDRWVNSRRQKFFQHLRSYIIVNGILFLIWVTSGSWGHPWFLFPLFGWGIGLAFNAADAFFPNERKVERGVFKLLARQQQEEYRRYRDKVKDVKRVSFDAKARKVVIQSGDKKIEIG